MVNELTWGLVIAFGLIAVIALVLARTPLLCMDCRPRDYRGPAWCRGHDPRGCRAFVNRRGGKRCECKRIRYRDWR